MLWSELLLKIDHRYLIMERSTRCKNPWQVCLLIVVTNMLSIYTFRLH